MCCARVCLIVDNPLRDLDGLALLAWQLAQEGVEVFLVSMSHKDEIYFLEPDLILVNYIRKGNKDFIDNCANLGISIGVLDTEGGILQDVDGYFGAVFKYIDHVDLYCLWGNRQYAALKKKNIFAEDALKITGCPRYDFCALPWSDALQDVPVPNEKVVLYNANFPIVHPRFQSIEKEMEELIKAVGFEEEYVHELFSQTKAAVDNVLEDLKCLATKFSDVTFVIRPHPFENRVVYEDFFSDFSNVEVHQSGPVFPWIKKAAAVLHYNCSTAIEAMMLSKEPIHMGWIEADLLKQPMAVAVSQNAQSLEELECMLEKVLNGQRLEVPAQIKNARDKIISDWFYASDGKNAERVKDAVLGAITKLNSNKLSGYSYFNVLFLKPTLQGDFKALLKQVLPWVLGRSNYNKLKRLRYKAGKEFDVADIQSIIKRIVGVVETSKPVKVDYIKNNRNVSNSIRVTTQ